MYKNKIIDMLIPLLTTLFSLHFFQVVSSLDFEGNCGNSISGYTPISTDAITPEMNGTKVMVTSDYAKDEIGPCTMMLCAEDNRCCNNCTTSSYFGDLYLFDKSFFGCIGSNCDYINKCHYSDGDIITVYGSVYTQPNIDALAIDVDVHCRANPTCMDYTDVSFGACKMLMGFGIINGTCQGIGGCGSTEYVFYNTMEECQEMCDAEIETIVETLPPIVETEDELPEDDFNPTCLDVGGEDFGLCKMFMGYGVVNGTCQGVGGCGSDYDFFGEMKDCESTCIKESKIEPTVEVEPKVEIESSDVVFNTSVDAGQSAEDEAEPSTDVEIAVDPEPSTDVESNEIEPSVDSASDSVDSASDTEADESDLDDSSGVTHNACATIRFTGIFLLFLFVLV